MRALTSAACALILTGCGIFGGQEQPDWSAIRDSANRHRVEVNQVAEQVAENAPLIQAVCALRGKEGVECRGLNVLWTAARTSIAAAHAAIDVYDITGMEIAVVERSVERVGDAAKRLIDAAKRVGEGLIDAVAHSGNRSGESVGGSDPGAATGSKEAPAEGGGSTAGDGGAGSGAKEEVTDARVADVPTRDVDASDPWPEPTGPAGSAGPGAQGDGGPQPSEAGAAAGAGAQTP